MNLPADETASCQSAAVFTPDVPCGFMRRAISPPRVVIFPFLTAGSYTAAPNRFDFETTVVAYARRSQHVKAIILMARSGVVAGHCTGLNAGDDVTSASLIGRELRAVCLTTRRLCNQELAFKWCSLSHHEAVASSSATESQPYERSERRLHC